MSRSQHVSQSSHLERDSQCNRERLEKDMGLESKAREIQVDKKMWFCKADDLTGRVTNHESSIFSISWYLRSELWCLSYNIISPERGFAWLKHKLQRWVQVWQDEVWIPCYQRSWRRVCKRNKIKIHYLHVIVFSSRTSANVRWEGLSGLENSCEHEWLEGALKEFSVLTEGKGEVHTSVLLMAKEIKA